ncbi:head decoration protein [Telmatospirillum sp.]|uniref:head decoration protein n=1 Tax=Telmatospirillum sp. TaxID=2079197 RepID=UPI00284034F2|nr:head decoration protein [Telmatospirillum sp.]MDR3438957.1 head decoration protein [Telmatospirillum sp.]
MGQTPLYEQWHDGGFIVSEANGHRSRDKIILTGGAKVLAGTVLGKQTAGSTAAAAALGANTGNGTFGAIAVGAGAVAGAYAVEFDSALAYVVSAPNGQEIGHGAAGAAFAAGGVGFTITAGSTAFAAGDSFTVTVAAGSGEYITSVSTAIDGSQVPAAILFGTTDATSADKSAAAITRQAEVNASEIIWDPSYSAAQITAGLAVLAGLGIIAR